MKIIVYHPSQAEISGFYDIEQIIQAHIDTYYGKKVPHCHLTDTGKRATERGPFMMMEIAGLVDMKKEERDKFMEKTVRTTVERLTKVPNAST